MKLGKVGSEDMVSNNARIPAQAAPRSSCAVTHSSNAVAALFISCTSDVPWGTGDVPVVDALQRSMATLRQLDAALAHAPLHPA